jgi:hypothetical protein
LDLDPSPAVKAVQGEPGDVLDNAIRRNVMLNVDKLRAAAPILNKLVDDKQSARHRRRLPTGVREGRAVGLRLLA